ncbi:MAG: alpha/beta fold hydrolase [Saprospiraceae bacterium]|nr:alpha/beta fold hydrolase [Saprospiraceae bacterium]
MIKPLLLLLATGFANLLFAQDITGDWHGQLDIQGMKLRLVLHIQQEGDGLKATLDSPDQGAFGLPAGEIKYAAPVLTFAMPNLGVTYKGEWQAASESFAGTFTQGSQGIPLTLGRKVLEAEKSERPQEPKPPFPYRAEDLTFANEKAGGIKLAGTLTLPEGKGPWPAAILISGSGPQNRDEALLGHKPFLVIADYLTRKGIAVLRFDDRGVGASEGDFQAATSADFATDVAAAVKFLRQRPDIRPAQVGLIGHSEGGLVAPMVAAKLPEVAFAVLLAGPGVNGEKVILHQSKLIDAVGEKPESVIQEQLALSKGVFKILRKKADSAQAEQAIRAYLQREIPKLSAAARTDFEPLDQAIDQQIKQLNTPWMRFFLTHEPAPLFSKVRCPLLILNGEKDLQVDPAQNIPPIEKALKKAKHPDYTIQVLPKLNHLFQHTETGNPSEYAKIAETFSPEALGLMTEWIGQRCK